MCDITDRFCIGIGYKAAYDLEDAFRCMAKAGFRKTFLAVEDDLLFIGAAFKPLKEYIGSFGLELCNLHVPAKTPDALWEKGRARDFLLEKSFSYIDYAAESGIRSLVFHVSGEQPIKPNPLGADAFQRICERAERYGIDICVENVTNVGVLDYLFENVESPSLKFCHDVGHNRVFTPAYNLAERYGNRLAFTHIHDNDGVTDLHEMPFTGVIDFDRLRKTYQNVGYEGILCLETTPQLAGRKYGGFENFFNLAYYSLERIFC